MNLNARYKLMGLLPSPYTEKLRSYLIFKTIPFDWISRNRKTEKLFQKHAKVQLIPMLFLPDGNAMQDSTLIMEYLEEKHPVPSMYPEDPSLRFLSYLLEEFGDEWCNKLMFFQRWFAKADQISTGNRIVSEMLAEQWYRPFVQRIMEKLVVRRMVPRLSFAGANETNIPHLQRSFESVVAILDEHLSTRAYLLGARPSFGDFGIWGNLYQAWTDPTAGSYINENASNLVTWVKRMQNPSVEGDFETLDDLLPTLMPLLKKDVSARFLKWTLANEKAWDAGEKETSLQIDGELFRQNTFKYHAFSLNELRKKYAAVQGNVELERILTDAGCLDVFNSN